MSFLGRTPSNAPLTTADIPDGIIVAADLAPNSVDSSELVDNAVTLAKMAGGTDGNLITYDTSGDPAYVATGTSGHVLTSAGADAVPTFQAAAGFASGTKMIFNQTAAPTGWTRVTSSNDVALRLVDGTSAVGTGGTQPFETAFASVTPTITMANDPVTLGLTHLPNVLAVTHSSGLKARISTAVVEADHPISYAIDAITGAGNNNTNSTGATGHSHANTAASSAINLDVSYVDVIIATKD